MSDVLNKLNQIVDKYFGQVDNVLDIVSPLAFGNLEGAVTVADLSQDAFKLNDPVFTGFSMVLPNPTKLDNYLLVRQLVSYNFVARVVADESIVNELKLVKHVFDMIQLAVNEMQKHTDMTNQLIPASTRVASIKVPGRPGVYFRDSEKYAGFEFRVWSKLKEETT
jgi:hypothetical protein